VKNELVNLLVKRQRHRRCLVLRTPFTGQDCSIDGARLDLLAYVVYRCPQSKSGVDWSDELLAALQFDVAILEPWHTRECSLRDLQTVFDLLPAGGALVCHDCFPDSEEVTSPDGWHACLAGKPWCGETFAAWVDFIACNWPSASYRTIMADCGLGVAIKGSQGREPDQHLLVEWQALPADHLSRYRFLAGAGKPLVNPTNQGLVYSSGT
jgi:hypothetical protein